MKRAVPRLLVVAHGTAAPDGSATTARLVHAVGAARPHVPVDLCFLDVVVPRLTDVLDDRPSVIVPLLLSTGYHVQSDIPGAVAAYPAVRVARHLGPDPLLVDVLLDRLPRGDGGSVALVGAGSSRPEAAAELAAMGDLLGRRLATQVRVLSLAEDVRAGLERLPAPVRVATYLLAEGQFVTSLRAAADGIASVGEPLGAHPSLVELVWRRYDEALETHRVDSPATPAR